jgi:hypothetical protein
VLDVVTEDVSWGGTRFAAVQNRRARDAAELEP